MIDAYKPNAYQYKIVDTFSILKCDLDDKYWHAHVYPSSWGKTVTIHLNFSKMRFSPWAIK